MKNLFYLLPLLLLSLFFIDTDSFYNEDTEAYNKDTDVYNEDTDVYNEDTKCYDFTSRELNVSKN